MWPAAIQRVSPTKTCREGRVKKRKTRLASLQNWNVPSVLKVNMGCFPFAPVETVQQDWSFNTMQTGFIHSQTEWDYYFLGGGVATEIIVVSQIKHIFHVFTSGRPVWTTAACCWAGWKGEPAGSFQSWRQWILAPAGLCLINGLLQAGGWSREGKWMAEDGIPSSQACHKHNTSSY